jgi:SAM-dependent methyltransferase
MLDTNCSFLSQVSDYYSEKLAQHGQTPHGVDWNGAESQNLRFEQLSRVFDRETGPFSVNDVGCGYGALLDFLHTKHQISSYLGTDISEQMVTAARDRHAAHKHARFILAADPDGIADYTVASGIFNVRLKQSDDVWQDYLAATLDMLNKTSRHGFAFNCLTAYSDASKKRDYLYYGDPCFWFDHCKRRYSRNVALLHDYGLWEFTILVRK